MSAYYNEIDDYCVRWLRNLIDADLIAAGDVDPRPIQEVQPDDLAGYAQCHFFAGIGGWSYAARLAGWPDDRPLWTGSCPCQPFSVAGKRKGTADPGHLWPHFFELIRAHRPPVVMGEQTDKDAGYAWFDGVATDLERESYSCRPVDIPACAVNAPNRRNRIYWVAHTKSSEAWPAQPTNRNRQTGEGSPWCPSQSRRFVSGDGRAYRIPESDHPFVVDGFPGCVDQISAIGNAINPELAAEVIRAYMEIGATA